MTHSFPTAFRMALLAQPGRGCRALPTAHWGPLTSIGETERNRGKDKEQERKNSHGERNRKKKQRVGLGEEQDLLQGA